MELGTQQTEVLMAASAAGFRTGCHEHRTQNFTYLPKKEAKNRKSGAFWCIQFTENRNLKLKERRTAEEERPNSLLGGARCAPFDSSTSSAN